MSIRTNTPDLTYLDDNRYIVFTEKGFMEAVKRVRIVSDTPSDPNTDPMAGEPTSYPSLVEFSRAYKGYHCWCVKCTPVQEAIDATAKQLQVLRSSRGLHHTPMEIPDELTELMSSEGWMTDTRLYFIGDQTAPLMSRMAVMSFIWAYCCVIWWNSRKTVTFTALDLLRVLKTQNGDQDAKELLNGYDVIRAASVYKSMVDCERFSPKELTLYRRTVIKHTIRPDSL